MPQYRTIFISDVHLGSRHCQAEKLLKFLEENHAEQLVLVGDILDLQKLKRNWYWTDTCTKIVRKFLSYIKHEHSVVYLPGNHEIGLQQFIEDFDNLTFDSIKICKEWIYIGIDGKKYLVTHGDSFDNLIRYTTHLEWLHGFADWGYETLIWANGSINKIRSLFRLKPWSLSKAAKKGFKEAMNYISAYEDTLTDYAKKRGFDGIISGHIHSPQIRQLNGIAYMNCGDCVESNTLIVEEFNGEFKLIHL